MILSTIGPTHTSDTFWGTFSRISASRFSSIASGVSSSWSLTRRYPVISFLMELIETLFMCPARRLCISARIWGLPVANIQVRGDFSRTCFSESRSLTRCTPEHSSRPSIHINVRREDAVSRSICTILMSWGLPPPTVMVCC